MLHSKEFDAKKNQILDSSEHLFITKGYEPTTVNAILKEVGIAKGTFYYYFNSKEEVMDTVITRIINSEMEFVNKIIADQKLTAIEKLITALFRKPQLDSQKNMIENLNNSNNALMKQRAMQRTLEIGGPVYEKIIVEGNKTKEFSSEHPLEDIQFLLAGMQTIYDISTLENSKIQVNIEAILDTMIKVLNIDPSKISKEEIMRLIIQTV